MLNHRDSLAPHHCCQDLDMCIDFSVLKDEGVNQRQANSIKM